MTEAAVKKSGGLAGVTAGETAISTVGKEGVGLTYRGYDIYDLAGHASFEEVAYLLHYGSLPNRRQLAAYKRKLMKLREVPPALRRVLETIPGKTHPMDVLRSGVSYLGNIEPEKGFGRQRDVADRLVAIMPGILLYWFHYAHAGKRIRTASDEDSVAAHFLRLLHGSRPDAAHVRAMDVSLILYAEHEFNASTFAARVCTATLSDFHSAIVAGIGTLRGPLHGGANEAAYELISRFRDPEAADTGLRRMLAEKKLIMGFGHRVYRDHDPRNVVIKEWSRRLAQQTGDRKKLFPISERIEQIMWNEKKLFPNLDFYSATVYHFMGIPTELFTPIFVCARTSGWSAHIMEQRGNNRLIRPTADYTGPGRQAWIPLKDRK
ncbi:MAG: 2-methylcitrate synthase [Gammaproteobacteria bacterium]|nr:2-methylcitrate synthase [Gammaproteobacteria bacterium]